MSEAEIDLDNLNMLKELLADRFQELIDTFLSDSEVRITKLKEALAAGDMDQVTHQAHGLKGSCRNIGANPLAAICEVVEDQSRKNALVDGEQQLAAIEQKFAAVSAALRDLQNA